MGTLDNKVAIVIGGTSGIGASTATLFAAGGASVIIAGRRRDAGERLAATLGPPAGFVRTDVTVEADVAALIARAVERFDRLDCLVNCAGEAGSLGGVATVDLEKFRRALAVHVEGVVAGMKYAAPVMLRRGAGSIVNIASIGGRLGGWTGLDYAAAKAAVLQLTRSVAVELGEHGIRVNCISPGPIATGIFAKGAGQDPAEADRTAAVLEPVFQQRLDQWQPIRRVGRPDDVAAAALWLASDASTFVNGQEIVVDGGISAGRPASVSAADRAAMASVLAPKAS